MTHEEVFKMLEETDLPVVYYTWKNNSAPALPYIVYYYPNSEDFIADNINYQSINALNIELYTENKDFALEQDVESILKENSLVYRKTETYLESEDMYEILYETEVIINAKQS